MKVSRRSLLASVPAAALLGVPALAQAAPSYRNANAPIPLRVSDLLGRMTLDEKVAQLQCVSNRKADFLDEKTGLFAPEKAATAFPNWIGNVSKPHDTIGLKTFYTKPFREPADAITLINAIQKFAVENTRLGIPVLFHEETAHGSVEKHATMFPTPPALGSTWDPELVETAFGLVARQTRLRGIQIGLSPVIDLVRDPRWGRSDECFGEDPFHVGEMGLAAVRGLQGRSRPVGADRVFATLKHFVHGTPMNGLNIGPADMSERALRETYLPPFVRAVRDGQAAIIMPSYNEVGGVPAHANRHLLQEIGRELLGFKGSYLSDYEAIPELARLHHMASDEAEAAILAINAGVDVDMPEGHSYMHLADLVRQGRVDIAMVDAAVSRVLALKFEAGLFEHPYVNPGRAAKVLMDPAGPVLARRVADKALVLLKNDGALPLSPAEGMRLAVIGPNSLEAMRGSYATEPLHAVGIFEGIKAAVGPGVQVEQADGVRISRKLVEGPRPELAMHLPPKHEDNAALIKAAVVLAGRSDVIVLCVGDNEAITREAVAAQLPGDRNALGLYGDQDELVDAILALGKPVIAVLVNGRPLAVNTLAARANAIIEAWYPGEQGGTAIADAILGKTNPGGKLAVGFPRSVGELPGTYSRHGSADKVPYVEGKRTMLFPFGFGLSYTTFDISAPRLPSASVKIGQEVLVDVDVVNTGKRAGDEVVQLYIRDQIASVPRAMLELKAFRRVTLAAGEKRTVRFTLPADALAFWDKNMEWRVEPGDFTIFAGNSSTALKETKLTVQ